MNDRTKNDVIPENLVFGRNAVSELLKSGRDVDKVFVQRGQREGSITTIAATAVKLGIPLIEVEKQKLDRLCAGGVHQGVCAYASAAEYAELDDIFKKAEEKGEEPLIAVADGIEDPHNLGALLRCCECAGVHGLIIPKRRSASLGATAAKASAGALSYVPVVKVPNIAACLEELKKRGVWCYAAEADGQNIYEAPLDRAAAFVFGSEGDGVSRIVREKCDYTVSIPMFGKINSLNVSCAAAVILSYAAKVKHSL
ncbi:MAG: 23S rRNA (guanosine(2251)-2'-O)-methyltransferase RlmB [Clostridia bacterium]|nr:23S rRNA (guanosine(2251)-2'-O)-methyltransferase RlmB [Clostridia bacterium]